MVTRDSVVPPGQQAADVLRRRIESRTGCGTFVRESPGLSRREL